MILYLKASCRVTVIIAINLNPFSGVHTRGQGGSQGRVRPGISPHPKKFHNQNEISTSIFCFKMLRIPSKPMSGFGHVLITLEWLYM